MKLETKAEQLYNPRSRPKCHICGYRGDRRFWIPLIEDSLQIAMSHGDNVDSIKVWWRCPKPKCTNNFDNWVTF